MMMDAFYAIASRFRGGFDAEAVADAADGFDQVFELPEFQSQRADVDVDGPFEGVGIFPAAAVHQFVPGKWAPRLPSECP
jgi:hypothetical protein